LPTLPYLPALNDPALYTNSFPDPVPSPKRIPELFELFVSLL
jgi:hypothetical protein